MRRIVVALGVTALLMAACVTAPTPTPTPRPTQKRVSEIVTEVAAITPNPAATEQTDDGQGDPVEGERLFHTFQPATGIACMTCHRTDSDDRLVGPGLKTVGIRAQTRVAGMSAFQYIHTSIVDPSAYVIEGYPDIMPKNWGKVFTEAQIDDLIAYLISLSP